MGVFEVVGKSWDGALTFEPGKDPMGRYYLVTPAFILKTHFLEAEVLRLALELKKWQTPKKEN